MASKAATAIWASATAALLASAALIPSIGAPLSVAAVFVAGIGSLVAGQLRTGTTLRDPRVGRRGSRVRQPSPTRRRRRRAARLATSRR